MVLLRLCPLITAFNHCLGFDTHIEFIWYLNVYFVLKYFFFVRYSTTPTLWGFLVIGRRDRVFICSWSTAPEESCLTASVVSTMLLHSFCLFIILWLSLFLFTSCNFLFSVIVEPDVGMPEPDAHRFFQQLIAAVVSGLKLGLNIVSCSCFWLLFTC